MHRFKKIWVTLTLTCLVLGSACSVLAANNLQPSAAALEDVLADTGAYLLKTVQKPRAGFVGGEWAVLGLARAGCEVPPGWFAVYYQNLEDEVIKKQGVLHDKKYAEYSRVVLALTALGKDPRNVGGYNLLARLGDFEKVVWQGINGPLLALLALDAGGYEIPECAGAKIQTGRELLLAYIIQQQLSDGGFSLGNEKGDPDLTAMALQALAPYRGSAENNAAIEKALACLARLQNADGGYTGYWGAGNVESAAQVLIALTALDIDPAADSRFIKNGQTIIDYLLRYFVPGGGFKHTLDQQGPDAMATEQAFYGLVAYDRFRKGEKSLYAMTDLPVYKQEQISIPRGLPEKNPAVTARPLRCPGKSFADIREDKARAAIEALAARDIISGVNDTSFEPGRTMTRAEFATIVVRALGLIPTNKAIFTDVAPTSWYAIPVGTAYAYGIVQGTTETTFSPEGTITREQAAVLVTRAAELCGLHTDINATETLNCLAQFSDYTPCSTWAREALAFCYQQKILSPENPSIKPQAAITRAETATMLYRMLQKAALI